jgi:hypothetical protein
LLWIALTFLLLVRLGMEFQKHQSPEEEFAKMAGLIKQGGLNMAAFPNVCPIPQPIFKSENVDEICQDVPRINLLIVIKSAESDFSRRLLIRRHWGNPNIYSGFSIRVVFLIGVADDTRMKMQISKEERNHGDVLKRKYYERIKSARIMEGFKWVVNYCSNVDYVISTQDDVTVFPENVMRFLSSGPHPKDVPFFMGLLSRKYLPNEYPKWAKAVYRGKEIVVRKYFEEFAMIMNYDAIKSVLKADGLLDTSHSDDDVILGACAIIGKIELQPFPDKLVYRSQSKYNILGDKCLKYFKVIS